MIGCLNWVTYHSEGLLTPNSRVAQKWQHVNDNTNQKSDGSDQSLSIANSFPRAKPNGALQWVV